MQVNFQGVEHDLQQIEQNDSRLYDNEDTQRVIISTRTNNNFANFVSSTGRHWQDAVEQNLIPDDIFVSHWKIPGKVEFDNIKTFGVVIIIARLSLNKMSTVIG